MTRMTAFRGCHEKLRIATRHWLLGRRFYLALDAMEFAAHHHTGTRRDGSPEFSHQIWQAHYVRTLEPGLIYPEETLATVFLHDVVEDYPVGLDQIATRFGPQIASSVDAMSKTVDGVRKSDETYFSDIGNDAIASICKGADRLHNLGTMPGAMSEQKQIDYLGETEADILPMLRIARRKFPRQDAAYENIKHFLVIQIDSHPSHIDA